MLPAIAPMFAWLLTITCPGGAGCVGNDYPIAHATVQDIDLTLTNGSVLLKNATLEHSQVQCIGTLPRPCVLASATENARLVNVDVSGAANGGIEFNNCTRCEVLETKVRSSDSHAVKSVDSTNIKVWGVTANSAKRHAFFFQRTTGFQLLSSLAFVGTGADNFGVYVDEVSTGKIARSRARSNGGEFYVPDLTKVSMTAVKCETPLGQAKCEPGHHGPPSGIVTVCVPAHTYPTGYCDFREPQTAIDSPLVDAGHIVILDTPVNPPWSPITLGKSIVLLSATSGGNLGGLPGGGGMQGSFSYYNRVAGLTVTSPGVMVSGFDFIGPVLVQPDTMLIEIEE